MEVDLVEGAPNFSKGIAIGAAIHPDAITKIENVRYPSGSGLMRLMSVPLVEEGTWFSRPLKLLLKLGIEFFTHLKIWAIRDWAKHTIILLVMQTKDQSLILGGNVFSKNRDQGVVNEAHEVFGHHGLYVCDGSVIPLNLGVNPSLTITAVSERFCAQFKTKDLV